VGKTLSSLAAGRQGFSVWVLNSLFGEDRRQENSPLWHTARSEKIGYVSLFVMHLLFQSLPEKIMNFSWN
jgi:hypothetical protein